MNSPTRIDGLDHLRKSFNGLAKDMQEKASRQMVAAAGGILRSEAKRLAQGQGLRKTGALIRNIAIKRERTADGVTQYNLGVRHGRNLGKKAEKRLKVGKSGRVVTEYLNNPFYWSFLEFGRNVYPGDGRRRRRVAAKSRVAATPFIAPALENKRDDALNAMATRLARLIDKANGK